MYFALLRWPSLARDLYICPRFCESWHHGDDRYAMMLLLFFKKRGSPFGSIVASFSPGIPARSFPAALGSRQANICSREWNLYRVAFIIVLHYRACAEARTRACVQRRRASWRASGAVTLIHHTLAQFVLRHVYKYARRRPHGRKGGRREGEGEGELSGAETGKTSALAA